MKRHEQLGYVSVFICLFLCLQSFASRPIADHESAQIEITACVVDQHTPLGRPAVFRAYVRNSGHQQIAAGLILRSGTDERPLIPLRYSSLWTPETRPVITGVEPTKSVLITGLLSPGEGASANTYSYLAEVCLVARGDLRLNGYNKKTYERDPCEAIGGIAREYSGTFVLEEPAGRDREFFERYKRKAYFEKKKTTRDRLGDIYHTDVLPHEEELRTLRLEPFENLRSKRWWPTLKDNSYSAQSFGLSGRIEDVDAFIAESMRLLNRTGSTQFREDTRPESVAIARHDTEMASYYKGKSEMAWQVFLKRSRYAYLGTREESKGIEALELVAMSSPDCTLRVIANRILTTSASE